MFQYREALRSLTTHFVMLVKHTLKEEVSVVIELSGAVCRDLYSGNKWTDTKHLFEIEFCSCLQQRQKHCCASTLQAVKITRLA